MDPKTYLNSIKELDNEIDALIQEKRSYIELATKITSTMDADRVQTSGHHERMAEIIAKIADTEQEITEKIDCLVVIKQEVTNLLKRMDNMEFRKIIVMKHVRYMHITQIAHEMHYDRKTIQRKYKKALEEFRRILSESDKK